MALATAEELIQIQVKARLAALKKLCNQAHKGDIYLFHEKVYVAAICWCISTFENTCERYCLIHYTTGGGERINTAESQAKMTKRISDGEFIGGSSFAKVLDTYTAKEITVSYNPPPKEQSG